MVEDKKIPEQTSEQMADELSDKLSDCLNEDIGIGGSSYIRILPYNVAELDGQFYPEDLRKIADEMDNLKRSIGLIPVGIDIKGNTNEQQGNIT